MTPINWSTPIKTKNFAKKLHLSDTFLNIGSCFADNIGNLLSNHKIISKTNPLKIAYNPVSIGNLLNYLIGVKKVNLDQIIESNNLFFHDDFHSSFCEHSKEKLFSILNREIDLHKKTIVEANNIIISFGTAWVYKRVDTGAIVNNCHKRPSPLFNKTLLSIDDIVNYLQPFFDKLPEKHFILTVSPIRHLKDGFEENNLSKSILRVAIDQLQKRNENISYFPSYEILMDELRDYRFYEEDLIHPNKQAILHIFSKFIESAFDEKEISFFTEIQKIRKDLNHRPFNVNHPNHQKFIQSTLLKLDRFIEQYPSLNFDSEKDTLLRQLN